MTWTWLRARPLAALVLLAGLLCSVGIDNELWTPDEPRDAEIGRAMWRSGQWAVPRLNGAPFVEKPPLFWWVEAGVFELAGRADATLARIPSALFSFATLLLSFALARRYFEPEAALLGALVLLTLGEFAVTSHWIVVDNALVAAVTAAWTCFAHAGARRGAARALLLLGLYAALAAGFLAKGVVGVAIPVLGMSVFLLWTRQLRGFAGVHLLGGALIVGGVAAHWGLALREQGGDEALRTFLLHNQLARLLPDAFDYTGGHTRPFWYYFVNAPVLCLPWTPFIALALVCARRNWSALDARVREGIALCIAASLPVIVVLSFAGTKRGLYLDPILPPLALLVGWWMTAAAERASWELRLERLWRRALIGIAALSLGGLLLPHGNWPVAALGAALLLLFGGLARRAPPVGRAAAHLASCVALCLAAASLFLTLKPFLDGYKSFLPFASALQHFVPADRPVHAYRPDETLLGVVGFYTERPVAEVDLEALGRMAGAAETQWVVVRDRRPEGGNYGEIRRAGIPHRLVSEQRVGNRRTLRILALGAMNTASERAPEQTRP